MVPAPTREFWLHVLMSKVEATIGNIGDRIGWESDEEVVGPVAFATKQSLLRAIPLIMPEEDPMHDLYRCVLEHGDFGIRNVNIDWIDPDHAAVTSLYDWKTACIAPAILSDPLVAVSPVDLTVDPSGQPTILREPSDATPADHEAYNRWAEYYAKVGDLVHPCSQAHHIDQELFAHAPELKTAIERGSDVRYLWFALRDWRGGDAERFFGALGEWVEQRILGISK
jgi:hypothetical protein